MKMKKLFALLAAVAMLASVCVGCTEKEEISAGTASGSLVISEKPLELKAFINSSKDDDGQWGVFKEAFKMTNINVVPTISKSNSSFGEAFNLMIASGNIPDIVLSYNVAQFCELAMEGAFVPLNEYFDDELKDFAAFLKENPDIEKEIKAYDGNIYYIPFIPGGVLSSGWFVRQDWLDKVGMEAPTNAEEMYEVLTAFKTQDPNGNGKADEVPYWGTTTEQISPLFPLWNARHGFYLENGKVKFGQMEKEYPDAIRNIIKWYKEGLIDEEVLTRASSARDKMLQDNIGGMTHDWFGSTALFNDTLKDKIPGFKFIPMAAPNGIEICQRPVAAKQGWGVSAGSEHLEESLRFINFFFTEEGNRLINYGVEGVHYDMVDGKPAFKPELLAQPDFKKQLTDFGIQLDIGYKQDYEYEKQWLNEIALEGLDMYEKGNWLVEPLPGNLAIQLTPEETTEYNTLRNRVTTYSNEMFQKWILGAEDFDTTYDTFKKQIKKLGYDDLITLMQKAYDRYNGK